MHVFALTPEEVEHNPPNINHHQSSFMGPRTFQYKSSCTSPSAYLHLKSKSIQRRSLSGKMQVAGVETLMRRPLPTEKKLNS